ncbi:P-loop containing nucleoside triphosphate hydrolase protein [Irpex rosettiformis]|uniref:P-loop containing nucleoside triphosphate hydrolase protein n=1 Tax=Irpex rosettiformis TaxID=378272 RepID=A0ACB8U974_9APHY|nr:P-loop containing nucleoside triphosphate hydrolase protein [Irpex rosettiformis]
MLWSRNNRLSQRLKRRPLQLAHFSKASSSKPIVHIPKSSIYSLGAGSSTKPLFHGVSWTIQPDEAWVITATSSGGAKTQLLQALTGHLRIHPFPPPPGGLFPFLEGLDPYHHVDLVSFAHRPRGAGGAFYDYTARYGAVREEDKRTLRETFFPELAKPLHELALPDLLVRSERDAPQDAEHVKKQEAKSRLFEKLTDVLGLGEFLDLPMIALSNGQTRRARIVKALLEQPELLILDEPLTGLDIATRSHVLGLLQSLHAENSPHIILGMRPQDPIPDWTTHLALIRKDGTVHTGPKEAILDAEGDTLHSGWTAPPEVSHKPTKEASEAVVHLSGVNVAYGDRKVLKNIYWDIHRNSRWHLIGSNGAGKTTLLAMLTGEHPQSYTQSSQMKLFSRPRAKWPTPHLQARIGRVSPEMNNGFPRRRGMTVWDAVGTGFEGNFTPRGRFKVGFGEDGSPLEEGGEEERWRVRRMWEVIRALGPATWRGEGKSTAEAHEAEAFSQKAFVDLPGGEQSIVLLMRALVGRPPLVILDEAWAGMDEGMVEAAKLYLREDGLEDGQACIVVSHWEEEVPWGRTDGVRRFRLQEGFGNEE